MFKISTDFPAVNHQKTSSGKTPSLLGNLEEITQPPPLVIPEEKQEINPWTRQDSASQLLPKSRVRLCMKFARDDDKCHTGILLNLNENDRAYLSGLIRCASVWDCYSCAKKITEGRRLEVREAVDRIYSRRGDILMGTFTVPHYACGRLKNSRDGITKAIFLFMNRKPFKRFCTSLGYVGRIRAFEVTYGRNGWHPHIHILFFFDTPVDNVKGWETYLLKEWVQACKDSGLVYENGESSAAFKLESGKKASDYVSKWGIEHEMTKGYLKRGRTFATVTPFQLLDIYAKGGKDSVTAGRLFKEYSADVFKTKQLVWSKGLRSWLGMEKLKTDQEHADKQEKAKALISEIPQDIFLTIRRRRLTDKLIKTGEQEGTAGVKKFLAQFQKGGLICKKNL